MLAQRAATWARAIPTRHSRRSFDGTPAPHEALRALEGLCAGFRPYPDARVVLVGSAPGDLFRGIVGSYAKVTGAPHALLVIAASGSPGAQTHAGYTGEAVILEATSAGLDTCWIGGFFDRHRARALVELEPGEAVVAASPIGHATEAPSGSERVFRRLAGSHERKPLDVIAPGSRAGWPAWALAAAEAVRVAPSAMNRQPWRVRMEHGALVIARDSRREAPRVTRALDCGIAMLHAEVAAYAAGITGRWADCENGLDVARFEPVEDA